MSNFQIFGRKNFPEDTDMSLSAECSLHTLLLSIPVLSLNVLLPPFSSSCDWNLLFTFQSLDLFSRSFSIALFPFPKPLIQANSSVVRLLLRGHVTLWSWRFRGVGISADQRGHGSVSMSWATLLSNFGNWQNLAHLNINEHFPSVLWHCSLGDRKGIRPVKKTGCWFVGGDDLTGALHVI